MPPLLPVILLPNKGTDPRCSLPAASLADAVPGRGYGITALETGYRNLDIGNRSLRIRCMSMSYPMSHVQHLTSGNRYSSFRIQYLRSRRAESESLQVDICQSAQQMPIELRGRSRKEGTILNSFPGMSIAHGDPRH